MAKPFLDREQSGRILRLAAPVIFAMLTQTGVNIVDTYFLKKLPCADASDAQAALTPALMLLWAVGGFLSAISVGTQAMTARRYGEDNHEAAGAVLPNSLLIALIGGAFFTVLGWVLMPYMFGAIVDNPHVAQLGTVYTRARFLSIAPMAMTAAYKSFFDGIGKTHIHLWAAIAMNLFNAAVCWVLIFGHWGFPRLGIQGAGIAACVASWAGMGVMAFFSLSKATRARFKFYRRLNLSRKMSWDLLRLSVPGGLATVAVMTGFLLFTKIVSRLDARAPRLVAHASECGGVHVAANGAATTIIIEVMSATFFSCLAFGTATATLVGQSMGAGRPDKAESYAWTSVKLGAIIFGVIAASIFVWAPGVMGVFSDSDAVISTGVPAMRVMVTVGPLIAVGMILTQALFGAGDTRYVMMVEMGLHFGCLVPLTWVLGITLGLGLVGIWAAAATYIVGLALFMSLRFAAGGWKKLRV